ncbi:putative toxin-antitoxin system toxin component, PIN family [Roseateles microcysteis]|uniref:putative toxin-antitoxin system toxin component, PIN family n=1 Tax=Roseateles microcysteis TaxID=3119057 RepID=UPI002FE5CC29
MEKKAGGYAALPMNPPQIVIDTQVIMDWLVFREPSIAPLVEAVQSGQVAWIGTPDMKAELLHVLGRGVAAERKPDLTAIEDAFAHWCRSIEPAPPKDLRLACRDPDDQMFIDLAVSAGARWLISRDRAVLALARRANKLCGLTIQKPELWIKAQLEAPP